MRSWRNDSASLMCKMGIQNSLGVPPGDDETFAPKLGKRLPEDILKVTEATIL